jgi:hypothetical protein
MKLFRLFYIDYEYDHDVYQGLFKTKESMFDYFKKIVPEYEHKIMLEDKDITVSESKLDNPNHTLFDISFRSDNNYSVEYYRYEIIDTDDLL